MTPTYIYAASVVRVIDGDTYILDLDLGFHMHAHIPIRLHGIDCPERSTPEGLLAQQAATSVLALATAIVVQTYRDQQSFARWVADVWVDGYLLADVLRAMGHVKVTKTDLHPTVLKEPSWTSSHRVP
jgi:endonuclease YncB( thermonuclease family)